MKSRSYLARASLLASLFIGAACAPTDLPGVSIGQYEVHGALQENTCAEGYTAPDALWFFVELRHEPESTIGWWRVADTPVAEGTLERGDGTFVFEDAQQVVGLTAEAGRRGCLLNRDETVEGQLGVDEGGGTRLDPETDGDGADGRFDGSTTVRVSAAPGSDCGSLINPALGGFAQLPCEVRYEISGERLAEDLW